MKSMTFAEFFAMPPGTIFGQVTGHARQFNTGLYVKVRTCHPPDNPEDDELDEVEIKANDLLATGIGADGNQWGPIGEFFRASELDAAHRFLVYEPADLDRLAGLIGRDVGHGEGKP